MVYSCLNFLAGCSSSPQESAAYKKRDDHKGNPATQMGGNGISTENCASMCEQVRISELGQI